MGITYKGSRIFYCGVEQSSGALPGFSNSTYTQYSSSNPSSGRLYLVDSTVSGGADYCYVAGARNASYTYIYITQLIFHTDERIKSFSFKSASISSSYTGRTIQAVISQDSTLGNASNYLSFYSRNGIDISYSSTTYNTITFTGLDYIGDFYVYLGPMDQKSGTFVPVGAYGGNKPWVISNETYYTLYPITYHSNWNIIPPEDYTNSSYTENKTENYSYQIKENVFALPQRANKISVTVNRNYFLNDLEQVKWNGYAMTIQKFVEWNTSQDGSGTSYLPGEIYTINKSLNLYAIWRSDESEEKIPMEFDFNQPFENNELTENFSLFAVIDEDLISTYETESITIYELISWNTEKDGTGISYGLTTYSIDQDLTIYGIYNKRVETQPINLPINVTKNEVSFIGWSKDKITIIQNPKKYVPIENNEQIFAMWDEDVANKGMYIFTNGSWHKVASFTSKMS